MAPRMLKPIIQFTNRSKLAQGNMKPPYNLGTMDQTTVAPSTSQNANKQKHHGGYKHTTNYNCINPGYSKKN